MAQDIHQQAVERFEAASEAMSAISRVVAYNPETGVFTLRKAGKGRGKVGSVVGSRNKAGYLTFCIDGIKYYAHRVAFLLAHGRWPSQLVDHINGDKADNRIANLRDVSRKWNAHNTASSKGITLLKAQRANPWRAKIDGQHLGVFPTAEMATAAYEFARARRHVGWVAR